VEWFCQGSGCFRAERGPEVYQAKEIHLEAVFSVSITVGRLLCLVFFAFILKLRVLSLFCSNPDALGVDDSEKGIFASLKSIAQLPPSPSKDDDRLDDSLAQRRILRLRRGRARNLPLLTLVSSFSHKLTGCVLSFAYGLVSFR